MQGRPPHTGQCSVGNDGNQGTHAFSMRAVNQSIRGSGGAAAAAAASSPMVAGAAAPQPRPPPPLAPGNPTLAQERGRETQFKAARDAGPADARRWPGALARGLTGLAWSIYTRPARARPSLAVLAARRRRQCPARPRPCRPCRRSSGRGRRLPRDGGRRTMTARCGPRVQLRAPAPGRTPVGSRRAPALRGRPRRLRRPSLSGN